MTRTEARINTGAEVKTNAEVKIGAGIGASALAPAFWRETWRQRVLAALPREPNFIGNPANSGKNPANIGRNLASGAELIPALLFADKYLLDSSDGDLFARSTLAHSLALSGLHLGYAAALGYFAVSLLYRFFPNLALRLPRRKAAVLGGALPALAYLWLGGAPPSLLRAAMMLIFVGWALFRNRPLVLADALIWALAAILLWNPLALFDLRLQLSALCIAALAWAQPLFALLAARLAPPAKSQDQPATKLASFAAGRPSPSGPRLALLSFAKFSPHAAGQALCSAVKRYSFAVQLPLSAASWKTIAQRSLRAILLILLSSLVIQIVLAPLLVRSFGLFGLAMPLNALWLPVLGFVVMPCIFMGLIAVILHLTWLAEVFFYAATLPCGWLLELLRWLDSANLLPVLLLPRPHWLSMLGYWLVLGSLPLLFILLHQRKLLRKSPHQLSPDSLHQSLRQPWPKLLNKLLFKSLPKSFLQMFRQPLSGAVLQLALALLLMLSPVLFQTYENSRASVRLRLLDVGQGQALLLEWQGQRLLLDGGGGSNPRFDIGREVVAATLTTGRLPRLEYLLASHLDQDHAQGLIFPLQHMKIGYYADNGESPKSQMAQSLLELVQTQGLKRHNLLAGERLKLGNGLVAEVLHPAAVPGESPNSGNKNSLVLRFVWQGKGLALACGDVDADAQRQILQRMAAQGSNIQAEVLLLPHHGSAGSLLPEFYSAVKPSLALASAGYGNSWNFPVSKVKNTLLEMGVPLLSSATCGQIQVIWQDAAKPPLVNSARWGVLKAF